MDAVLIATATLHWLRLIRLQKQLIERKKRFRRWWVKPHLRSKVRDKFGIYNTLLMYIKFHDSEEFLKMIRMTVEQFETLHGLVKDKLEKKFSRRPPLPSELRLALVLRYVL